MAELDKSNNKLKMPGDEEFRRQYLESEKYKKDNEILIQRGTRGRKKDWLYEQYIKVLEKKHRGEYAAVTDDGEIVIGKTKYEIIERAKSCLKKASHVFEIGYNPGVRDVLEKVYELVCDGEEKDLEYSPFEILEGMESEGSLDIGSEEDRQELMEAVSMKDYNKTKAILGQVLEKGE